MLSVETAFFRFMIITANAPYKNLESDKQSYFCIAAQLSSQFPKSL